MSQCSTTGFCLNGHFLQGETWFRQARRQQNSFGGGHSIEVEGHMGSSEMLKASSCEASRH